jgi:hypothetical protein
VKQEINKLKAAIVEAKEKEKKSFGGIFNKASIYTDKADNVIVHRGDNPKVFFDVEGSGIKGRVVMELFADVVPKTAEK